MRQDSTNLVGMDLALMCFSVSCWWADDLHDKSVGAAVLLVSDSHLLNGAVAGPQGGELLEVAHVWVSSQIGWLQRTRCEMMVAGKPKC